MSQQQYSTGTMKVKNTAGEMIPFYPKTQINCVTGYDGNILSEKISGIENNLSIIENSGSIEILYEEPTAENTSNLSNESIIAWIDEPGFIFIINTYSLNSSNKKTSIPFDLYNVNNTTLTVDWGDGTTSTFTKSDYASSTALTSTSSTSLIHTYEVGGEYMVTVTSNNFSAVKIYANSSITTNSPIYFYKYTLRQICSPFPILNVTNFTGCFENCSSLTSIPADLFKYNTAVTSFNYCFNVCPSLTTIPTDLFRYNTSVTDFSYCFSNCISLTSIPEDLFRYNTLVTTFEQCFNSCSSITSIPTDLFKYNTAATNFGSCFSSCSSITSIPTDLFKYNTAATNFGACFRYCSSLNDFTIHIGSILVSTSSNFVTKKTGTTRTVYVPTGSTTQTKFNSVASNLGLTIIGE